MHFAEVNTVIHYGAPHSLDDYLQERGRAGKTGEQAISTNTGARPIRQNIKRQKTSVWKRH